MTYPLKQNHFEQTIIPLKRNHLEQTMIPLRQNHLEQMASPTHSSVRRHRSTSLPPSATIPSPTRHHQRQITPPNAPPQQSPPFALRQHQYQNQQNRVHTSSEKLKKFVNEFKAFIEDKEESLEESEETNDDDDKCSISSDDPELIYSINDSRLGDRFWVMKEKIMEINNISAGAIIGVYLQRSLKKLPERRRIALQREIKKKHPAMWDASYIVHVALTLCDSQNGLYTKLDATRGKYFKKLLILEF